MGKGQVWDGYGMGMGWVWDGYGTGMVRVWDRYGTGKGPNRTGRDGELDKNNELPCAIFIIFSFLTASLIWHNNNIHQYQISYVEDVVWQVEIVVVHMLVENQPWSIIKMDFLEHPR